MTRLSPMMAIALGLLAIACAHDPTPPTAPVAVVPPVVAPLAFATPMQCGDTAILVGMQGDGMTLEVGGVRYALERTPAGSGARYVVAGDPATVLWSKGDRALLTLAGKDLPECVKAGAAPAALRASGNEPFWSLTIDAGRLVFDTPDPAARLEAAAPVPVASGEGLAYAVAAGGRVLHATVTPRVCVDDMSGATRPQTVVVTVDGVRYAGCGGEAKAMLVGAEWVVEDIAGGGVVDGARATVQFGEDGRVSGRASCNRYFGAYTLTGESLTFSALGSTRMMCPPPLMIQERAFLEVLGAVTGYAFDDTGALVLQAGDGRTIKARR
ncbi:MAG: META domain-containing protein [Hyphomonadaceae bacterium]|nr:META domain-containing protein [Hyphomonadaceae bacterium]